MKIILLIPTEALNEAAAERVPDAELYLAVGRAVRECLRIGLSLSMIAQSAQTTIEECSLALQYIESSTGFQLEALVEEWPWSRITTELASMEAKEARCKLAFI